MAAPSFISQQLSENTQDNKSVIRVINQLITNLNSIFQYNKNKVQLDSILLQQVELKVGLNNIPHTLNKVLTGWTITRLRGAASIYDSQDINTNKSTYLQLVSDVDVIVDLIVF